jgi:hypothetical protein
MHVCVFMCIVWAAGEFFFNSTTGLLYLYYNGTGAPPVDASFVVPQVT